MDIISTGVSPPSNVIASKMKSFARALILALALGATSAFTARSPRSQPRMTLESYKKELAATANAIASPGKGLLACDESTKTVGARLESIGMVRIGASDFNLACCDPRAVPMCGHCSLCVPSPVVPPPPAPL